MSTSFGGAGRSSPRVAAGPGDGASAAAPLRVGAGLRIARARRASLRPSVAAPAGSAPDASTVASSSSSSSSSEPALVRVLRGERLSVPPVWAMRQAGRYMASYRALSRRFPRFRDRSEIPELAAEISLQPWGAFRPDGVILFADILTLLTGLGVDWDVIKGVGPVVKTPVRSWEDLERVRARNPDGLTRELCEDRLGFLRTALAAIRQGVGKEENAAENAGGDAAKAPPANANDAKMEVSPTPSSSCSSSSSSSSSPSSSPPPPLPAVLGFAGAPFTLATYLVSGGKGAMRSPLFGRLLFGSPSERSLFAAVLALLEQATIEYVVYQADCGAEAVQIFDTWAGALGVRDYVTWAEPSLRRVLEGVRARRPSLPVILFVASPGGVLGRVATLPAACISVSHTVTLTDAWEAVEKAKREGGRAEQRRGEQEGGPMNALGEGQGALPAAGRDASPLLLPRALQGNVDPFVLMGAPETVRDRVHAVRQEIEALRVPAIVNLGHGIMQGTPEDNVRIFFEAARERF